MSFAVREEQDGVCTTKKISELSRLEVVKFEPGGTLGGHRFVINLTKNKYFQVKGHTKRKSNRYHQHYRLLRSHTSF